tara:strand:+ start:29 stop:925 length:897 start_codon:yes stop_codon:yes gene_type:complete
MALWTPLNLDNAQVWLKGGTGITSDGANPPNVSIWSNQIPNITNGQSFFNLNVSQMPSVGGLLNGIPGVDFDGTDEFLGAGDIETLDDLGTFMMAAVIKPTLSTPAVAILSKGTGAADGSFSWRINSQKAGNKLTFTIFDADNDPSNAVSMDSNNNPISNETDTICLVYKTSTTARHRVNGADNGSAGGSNFMNAISGNVTNSLLLGEFQGGGCDPYDGKIYEVVAVGNPFSNLDDIDSVEGYLAHRFDLVSNLPSSHQYFDFAPAAGLHGVHNQDLIGETSLDLSGPVVSDRLSGVV